MKRKTKKRKKRERIRDVHDSGSSGGPSLSHQKRNTVKRKVGNVGCAWAAFEEAGKYGLLAGVGKKEDRGEIADPG